MDVDSTILKTDVDDFINLVKKAGKITLSDAARKLGISETIIEAWTDFLVEERVLGIEYKFTTPYIYLESGFAGGSSEDGLFGLQTKEEFFEKGAKRKLPESQISKLWVKYLSSNEDRIKTIFFKKAKARNINPEKVEALWKKYYDFLRSGK